ncbi:hypothetical protein [Methylocystis echinoides]|uniref:Cytochrome c domain-containing protein n=1 Tax=Methylocystis echinoides TaxID=29468 RepID=A0A9W6LQR1_9HYPH|nr:hypothetical protein [Methylocystis echinoides]GLI91657.1 hypothetical protein LMG27198_06490 [Methylocystis echinoides]
MKRCAIIAAALAASLAPKAANALDAPPFTFGPNSFVNFETPHVHPLERTPDGAKLLAVNTAEGSLMVFDLQTGVPVQSKTILVGVDPVTVRARSATEAWVVNRVSNSISVVDLARGAVVDTLQICRAPGDVVFADGDQAVVSCTRPNKLVVVGASTRKILSEADIAGESPRALALSLDRRKVYAAIFESGNTSTVLAGDTADPRIRNAAQNFNGPYRGASPIPNAGTSFNPPLNPDAGPPPPVSSIVFKTGNGFYTGGVNCNNDVFGDPIYGIVKACYVLNETTNDWTFCAAEGQRCVFTGRQKVRYGANGFFSTGRWKDDTNGDWTAMVTGNLSALSNRVSGWDLPDRDVAAFDLTTGKVSYQTGLMNSVMAIGVNPSTGDVTAVGTEASNHIRFEPLLKGTFLKVRWARFQMGGVPVISDLNAHIDYSKTSSAPALKGLSIGDPRAIEWRPGGVAAYVIGMGSNNLIGVTRNGARFITVPVGKGPTGIAIDAPRGYIYVLNRFDATISVLRYNNPLTTVSYFDPTPRAIKDGRPFLYDTRIGSGHGQISCASCHIDARTDRLAWDLGNPAGPVEMRGNVRFHPMKGPMATQTLQNIIGSPSLHHRGDKSDLFGFADSFRDLQGAAAPLDHDSMAKFEAFLAQVAFPPNPNRELDNSLSRVVSLPGPLNSVRAFGDASTAPGARFCGAACHGGGSRGRADVQGPNVLHLSQPASPQSFQGLNDRLGMFWLSKEGSTVGTGIRTQGAHDSTFANEGVSNDMVAYMLSFEGPADYFPDRTANSHAGVGATVSVTPTPVNDTLTVCAVEGQICQVSKLMEAVYGTSPGPTLTKLVRTNFRCGGDSFGGGDPVPGVVKTCYLRQPSSAAVVANLMDIADTRKVGLVYFGTVNGAPIGGYYIGNRRFQTDRIGTELGVDDLLKLATNDAPIQFMLVARGSEYRIGVDADLDGRLNGDRVAAGQDPRQPVANSWNACATEGQSCAATPAAVVRYGAPGAYAYTVARGDVTCSVATFGDPAPGKAKSCDIAR